MTLAKRMTTIAIICYWIAATILTAGIQHARHNAVAHDLGYQWCRNDLGFSFLWGVLPGTLIMVFAMTGGAQYGWNLSCEGYK